jgi:hypothetical protein
MEEGNKYSLSREPRLRRLVRHLRDQMLRGAAYGVGSGAVSLLVLWYEHRH